MYIVHCTGYSAKWTMHVQNIVSSYNVVFFCPEKHLTKLMVSLVTNSKLTILNLKKNKIVKRSPIIKLKMNTWLQISEWLLYMLIYSCMHSMHCIHICNTAYYELWTVHLFIYHDIKRECTRIKSNYIIWLVNLPVNSNYIFSLFFFIYHIVCSMNALFSEQCSLYS